MSAGTYARAISVNDLASSTNMKSLFAGSVSETEANTTPVREDNSYYFENTQMLDHYNCDNLVYQNDDWIFILFWCPNLCLEKYSLYYESCYM